MIFFTIFAVYFLLGAANHIAVRLWRRGFAATLSSEMVFYNDSILVVATSTFFNGLLWGPILFVLAFSSLVLMPIRRYTIADYPCSCAECAEALWRLNSDGGLSKEAVKETFLSIHPCACCRPGRKEGSPSLSGTDGGVD